MTSSHTYRNLQLQNVCTMLPSKWIDHHHHHHHFGCISYLLPAYSIYCREAALNPIGGYNNVTLAKNPGLFFI